MDFLHASDPVTGEFFGFSVFPDSPWQAAHEAEGHTVIQSPIKPEPRTHFNYLGGVLTPKIEVLLVTDKAEIAADGVAEAVVAVAVAGKEKPANIDLLVAGTVETLNLTNGHGVLAPITAETPCSVEVAILDTITYWGGPVEIKAVEHG